MSEKLPLALTVCLSTGALVAGMVGYLIMPPIAAQVLTTAFTGPRSTQAAPNQAAPTQHPEVRRIAAAEAKSLQNALFVDVRSQGEYEAGHIKGSLWIPFEKVPLEVAKLPKGRPIVLYCT